MWSEVVPGGDFRLEQHLDVEFHNLCKNLRKTTTGEHDGP